MAAITTIAMRQWVRYIRALVTPIRDRAVIATGTSNRIPDASSMVVAKPKYSPARSWVLNV